MSESQPPGGGLHRRRKSRSRSRNPRRSTALERMQRFGRGGASTIEKGSGTR